MNPHNDYDGYDKEISTLRARCARLEEALRRIEDETRDAFAHNWSVRVTRIQRIAVEARAALAEVQK